MFNRFWVVARLYIYRPVNWLILVLGMLLICYGFVGSSDSYRSVTPHHGFWTDLTFDYDLSTFSQSQGNDGEDARRELGQAAWTKSGDPNAEAVRCFVGPEIPWDEFKVMPNLRQLRLRHFRTSHDDEADVAKQMRRAAEFPQVEYMSLPPSTYQPADVRPWESLTELEWLAMNRAHLTDGIASLPVFPKLHTLEIQLDMFDARAIAYLRQLPRLATLVIRDGSNREYGTITRKSRSKVVVDPKNLAAIRRIGELQSLERVYVVGREFGELESLVAASSPSLDVRPLFVNHQLPRKVFALLAGMGVLSLIVLLGAYGQFTRPEAGITPGYALVHHGVATVWIVLVLVLGIAAMVQLGIDTRAAISLGVLAVGVTTSMVRTQVSAWLRVFFLAACFSQFALLNSTVLIFSRRFLWGELTPLVTLSLMSLGCLGYLTWWRHTFRFHRELAERGIYFPVLTFKDHGRVAEVLGAKQVQSGHNWLLKWFVRSGDANEVVQYHNNVPAMRRKLLAFPSNQAIPRVMCLLLAGYCCCYCAVWYFDWASARKVAPIEDFVHVLGLGYLVFLGVGFAGLSWFPRRLTLPQEACRPVSRRELVNDIFIVNLRNVVWFPLALLFLAGMFLFLRFGLRWNNLQWLAIQAVYVGGMLVYVYGANLLALSQRHDWSVGLVAILSFIVWIASFVLVLSLREFRLDSVEVGQWSVLYTGAVLFLIGAAVTAAARIRWGNMEIGMICE